MGPNEEVSVGKMMERGIKILFGSSRSILYYRVYVLHHVKVSRAFRSTLPGFCQSLHARGTKTLITNKKNQHVKWDKKNTIMFFML